MARSAAGRGVGFPGVGDTDTRLGVTVVEVGDTDTRLGVTVVEVGDTDTRLGVTLVEVGVTVVVSIDTETSVGRKSGSVAFSPRPHHRVPTITPITTPTTAATTATRTQARRLHARGSSPETAVGSSRISGWRMAGFCAGGRREGALTALGLVDGASIDRGGTESASSDFREVIAAI